MKTTESLQEDDLLQKKNDITSGKSEEYIVLKSPMADQEEIAKKNDNMDVMNLENSLESLGNEKTLYGAGLGSMLEEKSDQYRKDLFQKLVFPSDVLELLKTAYSKGYTIGSLTDNNALFSLNKNGIGTGVFISNYGLQNLDLQGPIVSLPNEILSSFKYQIRDELGLNDDVASRFYYFNRNFDSYYLNPAACFEKTGDSSQDTNHQSLFNFTFDYWNAKTKGGQRDAISDSYKNNFTKLVVKYINENMPGTLLPLCIEDPSTIRLSTQVDNQGRNTFVIDAKYTKNNKEIRLYFG